MRYLAAHEHRLRGTFDFPVEFHYIDGGHPRYEMPFHWHMEHELLLVLSGSFSLHVNEQIFEITQGEGVLLPSGVIHGGKPEGRIYECMVVDLDRFFQLSSVCKSALFSASRVFTQTVKILANTREGAILDRLFEEMEKEGAGYELMVAGLLLELMGELLRRPVSAGGGEKEGVLARRMKDVLRCIREEYRAPLSLERLAAQAAMNPRYFCQVFRQITGRTPIDYLNYYRVECATELLCTTQTPITEIAFSCGFNDVSYFTKAFRRYKGMSPREYRRTTGTE